MYEECPKKYHFKYVEKIPEKPKFFFSFGHSVHTALEFFYGGPQTVPPTLDEVLGHYDERWESQGYKDKGEEERYKEEGRRILAAFHAKHSKDFRLPFFAEYNFNLSVDGVPVTGKVDRIDKLDNGKLAIVDYKTGKAFDLRRVQGDPQLTMYQMASEELLGMEVESLTFYHLPSLTPFTVERRPEDRVGDLRSKIVQTASSIQKALFEPDPSESKCKWCDYKPLCPAWKHMYAGTALAPSNARPRRPPEGNVVEEEAQAATAAPPVSEDEKLASLVDRYGELKEEARELESEAEEIKEAVLELLRRKGYVRAFGRHFEVSWSHEEKWDFPDRLKVLEVLKAAGLYDQVLSPNASLVQKLLKDPGLPADVRTRLQSLGERTEHSVVRLRKIEE